MKVLCSKFATIVATSSLFATGAFAQQDECIDAIALPYDTLTAFDTTLATESGPDFSCAAGGGDLTSRDVWFTFTSTADYMAQASTCGMASYDTKIEVYEGSCAALVSVACNDDTVPSGDCPGFTSIAEFMAVNGTQYWVRIGGWQVGDFGTGDIVLSGPPAPPYECADAAAIFVDTLTDFDTTSATVSAPDFSCAAGGGELTSQDVWFTFVATADYMAQASTCGTASYDTKLEVYEGACGALVTVVCNDDTVPSGDCPGFTSRADFMAVNGTQYWVRVGGWQLGDFGPGQLLVTGPPPVVPNDECVAAIGLDSGVEELFDNTLATFSASAPAFTCGNGAGDPLDLWYSFTVLGDGMVDVDTCLSAFDTRLEVYSGDCGTLVSEACNDDNGPLCAGSRASVSFAGIAGTTYIARVAGFSGGSGAGSIIATYVDSLGNDDCVDAQAITKGMTTFNNEGATASLTDLPCSTNGEFTDIWFSYTASADCPVSIDLSGSDYDTAMQLFTGDCMTLVSIACDDDGGTGLDSFISFDATMGTTYLIQIGGFNGATGDGIINLTEGLGSLVCLGELNSTGMGAMLKISGSDIAADNDLVLNGSQLPMNTNVLFINSREVNFVANPGGSEGNICIASFNMGRHVSKIAGSGATGTVAVALDLANIPTNLGMMAAVAGETWYWQGWYRDTVGGVSTSNFTAATCVTFQ